MPFDCLPLDRPLTAGEIVTVVTDQLVRQGKPGISRYGNCTYYDGVNRTRCAVGWLLTEAEAKAAPKKADLGTWLFSPRLAPSFPDRLQPHYALLRVLQEAHDSWALAQRYVRSNMPQQSLRYADRAAQALACLRSMPGIDQAEVDRLRQLMLG